ncbi:hypothetical protein [Lutibacter sp.]|uniref:hypothetical protein n=1 Tax=Lutibacter sp. TaxID=1925666 RepID=UPI00273506C4|nr:hypothetical protein [Lutibacter sp.]MDP3313371.1 hypothetical protein [Lutibacter sp.]
MTKSTKKPTTVFWIISITALVWNLMGVSAYIMQAYMTNDQLALLPEGEQNYYNNIPAWVMASFAIAVFAGAFGSIGLLVRKKLATLLFAISLIAVLAQFTYNVFIQKFMEVGNERMIMPVMIILIAVFLVYFSKKSEEKGMIS